MERTAEVVDTATGSLKKTGKGAVFVGQEACQKAFRDLESLNLPGGRFLVDWRDQHDILATFRIDEDGFRYLVGEEPQSPEHYERVDAEYWERARIERLPN